MIDSAVTDLPEPDSPTSATVSPLPMSKETWSTARISREPRPKAIDRSRTERRLDVPRSATAYSLSKIGDLRKAEPINIVFKSASEALVICQHEFALTVPGSRHMNCVGQF